MPNDLPTDEAVDKALTAFAAETNLVDDFDYNALAVYALQLRFGIDDASELADSVVDGTGDKKADIIYIDEESGTAVIVQAHLAEDATRTNPPLNKASDLNTAASWLLNPNDRDKLTVPMQGVAALLHSAIKDGEISTIELWYSHNLVESDAIDDELSQAAKTAASALAAVHGAEEAAVIECRGVQVGRESLGRLYAQRTSQILIEDVIDVPTSKWIAEQGDAWTAVSTSVSGDWLRELHNTYGADQLFAGNIRDYLGRRRSTRNINFRIEQTAENQPRDFWAFNNGITALVDEIITDEDSGSLKVRGLTIVNGAQTTGALASANSADGVSVLARFVQASDNELVNEIIRANNTQNEIRASDFRSSDPHQERLRSEFAALPGAHYAGARRGELTNPKTGAGDLFIGSDQAAQALAAFHGHPQRAYHGKSKIWEEDALYAQFFGDHTTAAHIVFTVALHHAVVDFKKRLRVKEEPTETERGMFEFLAQRGAVFLVMAAFGRCQEIILGRPVPDRYSLSFGELVSPMVAQEKWAPLVESLMAFHAQLQPAAESGRIRVPTVRDEAINGFAAQVQAVRVPLTDILSEFAVHILLGNEENAAPS